MFLGLMLGVGIPSHASLIITDFNSQNLLSFAFPGSTCANPPNQLDLLPLASIVGPEVLPISGGNPTVSGVAGALGLNLNVSGDDGLELTARLLSGNQAALIQILLFDADGTILRFDYPTSDFNVITFSPATASFSSATTIAAGSIPGISVGDVTTYEVQGDFFDGGGVAPVRVQFDDQTATSAVPEPSSGALISLGGCLY
jgi:hypothetical protein